MTFLLLAATNSPATTSSATPIEGAQALLSAPRLELWLVGAGLVAALAVAGVVAIRPIRGPLEEPTRATFYRSPSMRFVMTLVVEVLVLGAVWRAWGSGPDGIFAAMLAGVLVVCLMPLVSKVSLPWSASIEFSSEAVKEVKTDVERIQQDSVKIQLAVAFVGRVITQYLTDLVLAVRETKDGDARAELIRAYLADATEIVSLLLRPLDPGTPGWGSGAEATAADGNCPESVRVSAWLIAIEDDREYLSFVAGWPDSSLARLTGDFVDINDQSPAATVFHNQHILNYAFVQDGVRPGAHGEPDGAGRYAGLLVVPLLANGQCVGVLQVERQRQERFEPISIAVARQLAALYAGALSC